MSEESNNKLPLALVISDLWGHRSSSWWEKYREKLSPHYTVTILDATTLAGIDSSINNQEEIHNAFLDNGIDKAVDNLIHNIKEADLIIGCSVGGVIAWRACLEGLQVTKLITISSTRLRYETSKPSCNLKVVFGSEDPYAPKTDWFKNFNIKPIMMTNHDHDLYMGDEVWKWITPSAQ